MENKKVLIFREWQETAIFFFIKKVDLHAEICDDRVMRE